MSSRPPSSRATRSKTAATSSQIPTTTRTTRRTATTTSKVTPAPTPAANTAAKKSTTRKPLGTRDNSVEDVLSSTSAAKGKPASTRSRMVGKQATLLPDPVQEPIMAFLRIRPHLGEDEPTANPYLAPLSDTIVRMTDPQDPQNTRSRYRASTVPPSSTYTFSHIFPADTTQSEFFTKTTLPLVKDALEGQNGLLFTYGVTNSGKTYTVQGGSREGTAGILPRTLDVVFNSIEGLHGDGRYRPVRLYGVEPADPTDSRPPQISTEPAIVEVLSQGLENSQDLEFDVDPTTIKLDRNYEYTIWLSYAEVYNEKVYDLLASVKDGTSIPAEGTTGRSLLLTRQALPLKASPPSDNQFSDNTGKYIAGLRQFRVHSASQAKNLVKLGQIHRRVFGTLANRESSRSHGMVIIKIVRGHRGERNDPTALQISRLTLVDLAGSERTKHTHTTGDRLKEAGNINKSLMVLGQCLEVMRSNQRKLAASLAHEGQGANGRLDTRDIKRGLAIVPFRHSKLTEALMDYFIHDGRAVMIVNVNPYDTGYDENSHVMKFAALAREVYVTPAPAPMQRIPVINGPGKLQGNKIKQLGPLTLKGADIAPNPYRRKVTLSLGGIQSGNKPTEAVLEVLEEDEADDGQNEYNKDDEPGNSLVDELFDEIEYLRLQLFESEMRCATIEAEVREEVIREMEERMRNVEQMYSRRLMRELEQNEMKTDAKIDMLHQSGLFGSPVKKSVEYFSDGPLTEEEDVEMSLLVDDNESEDEDPASPLAGKGKLKEAQHGLNLGLGPVAGQIPAPFFTAGVLAALKEENSMDVETEHNDNGDAVESVEDSDESEYMQEEEEEEEWVPERRTSTSKSSKGKTQTISSSSRTSRKPHSTKGPRVSKLEQDLKELTIQADPDDSITILPTKKYRPRIESSCSDHDGSDEDNYAPAPAKKKKRQLGKKAIRTEEDIERVTYDAEKQAAETQGVRRLRLS
ncbi:P-loop containing nucleoside triphosphate hydrolase protein [Cyathus striatus]|nr:P-loop containing nucleoside triphosphate hydrolase protein [Cyathus striatus]